MYRNYIFEFYGTLADIHTDEDNPWLWEKMSEIYRAFGAEYGPRELKLAFRKLERREKGKAGRENTLRENAEPDLTRVFSALYHEKGVYCEAEKAEMTAVVFRALSRDYLRLYDGVEELLGELRRRGKGIYLLSNAQADFTMPEIRMLGIDQYFNGIFLSSEQGCKKPSDLFFRRLLERYGLEPSESIMIGNDETADIAGAKSVGMDTLYFHTEISPEQDCISTADYCVMDGDFGKIGKLILREDNEQEE